jgi:tetratricopeptide (TPR) repeat protein
MIVKGVCELQLGRFEEAERSFLTARRHPDADENSSGGLGQVYFRRGRYEDALVAFQDALSICRPGLDAETRWNILSTEIMLERMPEDLTSLDVIRLDDLNEENRVRVQNVRMKVLWNSGWHQDALSLLAEMRERKTYNATTVVYGYMIMKEFGQRHAALDLLRYESMNLEDVNLFHHLAHLFVEVGQLSDAIDVFERRICIPVNNTRQYMIEYARLLYAAGRQREAQQACLAVLSREHFPLPCDEGDFFYNGYANYLLGNRDRAHYDHERSAGLGYDFYSTYE